MTRPRQPGGTLPLVVTGTDAHADVLQQVARLCDCPWPPAPPTLESWPTHTGLLAVDHLDGCPHANGQRTGYAVVTFPAPFGLDEDIAWDNGHWAV